MTQEQTRCTHGANHLKISALTFLEVPNVLGSECDADTVHPRFFLAETLRLNVGHGRGR